MTSTDEQSVLAFVSYSEQDYAVQNFKCFPCMLVWKAAELMLSTLHQNFEMTELPQNSGVLCAYILENWTVITLILYHNCAILLRTINHLLINKYV